MEYKVVESKDGVVSVMVENEDGSTIWIPTDPANSDYQQYLVDTDGGLPIPKEGK
jgi:hypothetical protein